MNAGIGMNGSYKQFNGMSDKLNQDKFHENQFDDSEISAPGGPPTLLENQDEMKSNEQYDIQRKYNKRQTTNDILKKSTKTDKVESEIESKESEAKKKKNCEKMEASVELDKKTEETTRKRTESEKEKLILEKRDEEMEGRKRVGSLQHEKKKEEMEEKPKQMMRQRSETRSEQLSQVIGGI